MVFTSKEFLSVKEILGVTITETIQCVYNNVIAICLEYLASLCYCCIIIVAGVHLQNLLSKL